MVWAHRLRAEGKSEREDVCGSKKEKFCIMVSLTHVSVMMSCCFFTGVGGLVPAHRGPFR